MKNSTIVYEFILQGFHMAPRLKILFFLLILLCYTITVTGNFIILLLVFSDPRLYFPMYYFLSNLAVMDICFISTVIPGMLKGFLKQGVPISLELCLMQSYIYFLVGMAEFLLFAVMSFDRYLAICKPLHYTIIMHRLTYRRLIAGVWLGAFIATLLPTVFIMKLQFCKNQVDNFFCDLSPLLTNSCTDTSKIELLSILSASPLCISVVVTLISYLKIGLVVKKMDSADGRGKTLSTCSSHAIVVTLIYSSCIFLYAKPAKSQGASFNKGVAIMNTVVVPLLNPFIYTLRNQTVRKSFSEKVLYIFFKKEFQNSRS